MTSALRQNHYPLILNFVTKNKAKYCNHNQSHPTSFLHLHRPNCHVSGGVRRRECQQHEGGHNAHGEEEKHQRRGRQRRQHQRQDHQRRGQNRQHHDGPHTEEPYHRRIVMPLLSLTVCLVGPLTISLATGYRPVSEVWLLGLGWFFRDGV